MPPRIQLMPWAPSDWRTSRVRIRSMLTGDVGLRAVYRELLDSLWENGGSVSSDPEWLADDLGFPVEEVVRVLPILMRRPLEVVVEENGVLINRRIQRDLAERREFSHAQALRGARGGFAKAKAEAREREKTVTASATRAPADGLPNASERQADAKRTPGDGLADAKRSLSDTLASYPYPFPYPLEEIPITGGRGGAGGGSSEPAAREATHTSSSSPGITSTSTSSPVPAAADARPAGNDEDGFLAFLGVYPKRVGREKARAAWRNLRPAEREAALAAVPAMAAAWKDAAEDRLQFLSSPAKWLEEKRWTDDPAVWRQTAGTNGANGEAKEREHRKRKDSDRAREIEQTRRENEAHVRKELAKVPPARVPEYLRRLAQTDPDLAARLKKEGACPS